jgi:hypothetical protein
MFVQVIKGRTNDAEGLRRHGDRWAAELRPGAAGYLGGTAGIADDGTFVALARFEDEAAAKTNSDRPEQTAWWDELLALVDGEPTVRESSDVQMLFGGGSNDAGFVQVMEGTAADRAKAEALETPEMLEQLRTARPDLIGSLRVWFPDGAFVEAAYFTSEEAARAGESSTDFSGAQEDFNEAFGEMTFIDLRDPQLH